MAKDVARLQEGEPPLLFVCYHNYFENVASAVREIDADSDEDEESGGRESERVAPRA